MMGCDYTRPFLENRSIIAIHVFLFTISDWPALGCNYFQENAAGALLSLVSRWQLA